MATYNVLMTTSQYIEVLADTAKEAEMQAFRAWQMGEVEPSEYPEFVCEECDLISEDE
jgi:hypothetical protein